MEMKFMGLAEVQMYPTKSRKTIFSLSLAIWR
jgi:hypothetical protein